jgi:plastocyanin
VTSIDGSIDSPFLTSGQSFAVTFSAPGRLDYYCRLHQQMTAVVVVH